MGISRSAVKFKRVRRDHYPTHESAVDALLEVIKFRRRICDPCCGPKRQILQACLRHGHSIASPVSDIIYGFDFIRDRFRWSDCDIISNPPYGDRTARLALEFVERALEVVHPWRGKVAMLLPADFDSGNSRRHVFEHSAFAATVVLLNRVRIFRNRSGTTNHRWFVWDWKKKPSVKPITLYSHISYGD